MDNFTCGDNSSCVDSCRYRALCFMDLVFIIAITFLILIGNIGNLFVFLLTPSFRNAHGAILISLAFADLGTGVVSSLSIYPMATFLASSEAWPYGETACQMTAYFSQVFLTSSGTALTLLSIERYIAVVHPLKYSQYVTKKVTVTCLVLSWLVIAAVYVTILTGNTAYLYVPALFTCAPGFLGEPALIAFVFFIVFIPDCIVVFVTSCRVSLKLKSHDRRRAEMVAVTTTSSPSQVSGSTHRGASSKKTVKLFRMVRVMTIAVLVSWLPFGCVAFLVSVTTVEVPNEIFSASYWLLLCNGFFNSLIYFLMNKTYHDRLDELCGKMIPRFCFRLNDREIKTTCFCCTNSRRGTTEDSEHFEHAGPTFSLDLEGKV